VRLGEDLGEEELEEPAVVAKPVVAVVLRPALVVLELVVEPETLAARRSGPRLRFLLGGVLGLAAIIAVSPNF